MAPLTVTILLVLLAQATLIFHWFALFLLATTIATAWSMCRMRDNSISSKCTHPTDIRTSNISNTGLQIDVAAVLRDFYRDAGTWAKLPLKYR